MKTKFYFNLIEISLAIAVLAIGLSSIMVLFPVGIKANSAAIVDNVIPDVAGQFMGMLQAQVAGELQRKRLSAPGTEIILYDVLNTDLSIPAALPSGDSPAAWTSVPNTDISFSASPCMYRIEQTSQVMVNGTPEKVVDFSAEIRLGLNNYGDFFYNGKSMNDGSGVNNAAKAEVKKYFVGVDMEISWPTDIPYAKRKEMGNFRTYRMEFYNNPQ